MERSGRWSRTDHILLAAAWCVCACLEVCCCSPRANSPKAQCYEGQVFVRQALAPHFNQQLVLLDKRPRLTTTHSNLHLSSAWFCNQMPPWPLSTPEACRPQNQAVCQSRACSSLALGLGFALCRKTDFGIWVWAAPNIWERISKNCWV